MKLKVIQIFMLAALAVCGIGRNVQAISLSQSIDKTEMAFEDSAVFEITVEWPGSQFAYRFTGPLSPYIDRLKIGRFSSSIISTGSGQDERTTKKFTYDLIPTSGGNGKIDPITISYVAWPDSVAGELITEPVKIIIADQKVIAKSNQFPLWIPIVGGLMLLGGGAAVYVAKIRTAKGKQPVKSPADTALEELAKLKIEAGNDLKRFQTGVYNILSNFLNKEFNVNVTGQSEEKIDGLLAHTSMSEPKRNEAKNWLVQAEKDKFRPVDAAPGETVRLETELRRFFENLK